MTPPRDPGRRFEAVFAADLHLQASDPAGLERAALLLRFSQRHSDHLYLLGDVFDLWTSAALLHLPEMQSLYGAFRDVARAGLRVRFLPGNRDFNLTEEVGKDLGLEVGGEALRCHHGGLALHLCHGDEFLLRDRSYQRYKRWVRSAPVRFLARRLPAPLALRMARRIRRYSQQVVPDKTPERLAIVEEAVMACFATGARGVVCGHVHRAEEVDYGDGCRLWVLPPFLEEARFAVIDAGGLRMAELDGSLHDFPRANPASARTHGH